ncbi:MAG: response regulator transcription factor [Pseudomonadota bacterium]
MIIFVENRQLVVDGYKSRFKGAGETLVRLNSEDMIGWLLTSPQQEISTIEAVLIGEANNVDILVSTIRKKLNIPVIALLDNRSLEQTLKCYRHGVDDVVAKPVHYEELLIRIATIKKRLVQPVTKTSSAGIRIYFDGRDPEIAGSSMELPRRERRILEYLASIDGRRASKSQIFGAIYGAFDDKIDESVIESHISKLRKKLRNTLGKDPIDSKRYLGYRLDPDIVSTEKSSQEQMVA